MTDGNSTFNEIKASIEQLRDEIKLKAHLGKEDTKEELEKLDKKWQTFLAEYKPLVNEAGKTMHNAGTALGLAADELKAGYDRIRKLL